MYEQFLVETQSGGRLAGLGKIPEGTIKSLLNQYPGLPKDYQEFLRELGAGEIGQSSFVFYNGILEPEDIYDQDTAEDLDGILFFGDDMQGYCSGFDVNNDWAVVEVDPSDMSVDKISDNFYEFLRDKLKDI